MISFNIPTAAAASVEADSIPVITIGSTLPTITDPVVIDGTTQPGDNQVKVDGNRNRYDGLRIIAGNSTVKGLVITRFGPWNLELIGRGLILEGAGGNLIENNVIGSTNPDEYGNGGDGVQIVGSPGNTLRNNVIANNGNNGVAILGSTAMSNTLEGNGIGSNREGTARLGNLGNGIFVNGAPGNRIGGTTAAARNVVSANALTGIVIMGGGAERNVVIGNEIGEVLYNFQHGVFIDDAPYNRIGGATPAERNIISSNEGSGVVIAGVLATENTVQGNYIGLLADGLTAEGNHGEGVLIANGAHSNHIGGLTAAEHNVISGNECNGIAINSGATGNQVTGNWIGTDALGTNPYTLWIAVPNKGDGILIENAPGNIIGQPAQGSVNAISGNKGDGVEIRGAASEGTVVRGNYIGLTPDGIGSLGNQQYGIFINGAPRNSIGGPDSQVFNAVSANVWGNVKIEGKEATGNWVQGLCIGLDGWLCNRETGSQYFGVYIKDAPGNHIGGDTPQTRNIIHARTGVEISGGQTGNVVEGNYIGTNKTGDEGRPHNIGVRLNNAGGNLIGGVTPGTGNLISDATYYGIEIVGESATGNRVQGNYIGTAANGTAPIPNYTGVRIAGSASDNHIGGIGVGEGNLIAFSAEDGVCVESGRRNAILGNRIFASDLLGIDLGADGVTPNDAGDGDSGPNDLLNFPNLDYATGNTSRLTIGGRIDGRAGTTVRVEFFANPGCNISGYGEGTVFLGAAVVTQQVTGTQKSFVAVLPVSAPVGQFVTATATDEDSNTSEFSACVGVQADADGDGISDAVENAGPNNGDGNRDGIPDSLQPNVTSHPDINGDYATFVSPQGTTLAGVRAVTNPSPGNAPPGVEFPVGFFDFMIEGMTPESRIVLLLMLHGGGLSAQQRNALFRGVDALNSYWKFGPTPDDPTWHWYEFAFDGTTGAEISGNTVTLHLVDGQRGDADLTANGVITDPGAPAWQGWRLWLPLVRRR